MSEVSHTSWETKEHDYLLHVEEQFLAVVHFSVCSAPCGIRAGRGRRLTQEGWQNDVLALRLFKWICWSSKLQLGDPLGCGRKELMVGRMQMAKLSPLGTGVFLGVVQAIGGKGVAYTVFLQEPPDQTHIEDSPWKTRAPLHILLRESRQRYRRADW